MRRLIALIAGLAAAGCGGPAEEPAPAPVQTASEGPRRLVAEKLDRADLGPRIVGPDGSEVESDIPGLAKMVSYVACPASIEAGSCDPARLPHDTVYTYVLSVTLDEAGPEQASDQWTGGTLLRTIQPAAGFSFSIGYDEEQALETLGKGYEIRTQIEDGALIWRVVAGDGWMPGETLTFYWRSTKPPAGPAEVYRLEADGLDGIATGPFPAEELATEESGDETPSP